MKAIFGLTVMICLCFGGTFQGDGHCANKGSNISIEIEVIGFDIKAGSKEERELQATAKAGGGTYYTAENADKLVEVFKRAVEDAVRKTTPPTTPSPTPPKPRPDASGDGWERIGDKTARRLIFHLRDKVSLQLGPAVIPMLTDSDAEVISALTTLGYSVVEAQTAVQRLPRDSDMTVEDRLRMALTSFGST